jgi:hypothetical protein
MSAFGEVGGSDPLAIWEGVVGWEGGRRADDARAHLTRPERRRAGARARQRADRAASARSLRFRIGVEERDLRSGASWSIRSQTPHAVVAGPDGARLVEAFAPARDEWAELQRISGRRVELA